MMKQDHLTRSIPDPESSPQSPCSAEPNPTDDGEPETAARSDRTKDRHRADAASSAPCTVAEGELSMDLGEWKE